MEGDALDHETGFFDSKNISQRKWENARYRGLEGGIRKPEANSIHRGTVRRIQPFGAFVSIEGMDRDGLLHISCLSAYRVEKVEDVLTVGDKVWVKVMSIDEDGKYKLDMRGINQKDGTDTDPNDITRASRSKPAPHSREAPIKLDAILNVRCTRCNGSGHLRHECYNTTGQNYEMLEEESGPCVKTANPEASAATAPPAFATGANAVQVQKPLPVALPSGKEKKEKTGRSERTRDSKRTKEKKRRRYSSSGSDTGTSSSSGSRRKKKKKRKKKEKKLKVSRKRKRES